MNASIDKPDDIWKKTLWPLSRDYIYALLLREFRLIWVDTKLSERLLWLVNYTTSVAVVAVISLVHG